MTAPAPDAGTVAAVRAVLEADDEADAILRDAVRVLAERSGTSAGIRFHEEGAFVPGPLAGGPAGDGAVLPVRYEGDLVAELVAGRPLDDAERATWEAIADLLGVWCLVGWDTGGEDWEP